MKKKNRRILARNVAQELSREVLCQITAGCEDPGGTCVAHHTNSGPDAHDDCHFDTKVDSSELE